MEIIIESPRDLRVFEWLTNQVGEEAILDACLQLTGARKAYVSNVAKVLKLSPPAGLTLTPKKEAIEHLQRICKLLKNRSEVGGENGQP